MKSDSDLKSRRPLSPHLTIYKPQITSVLSILHRISGVALYFSFLGLTWLYILASLGYFEISNLDNCQLFKIFTYLVIFGFFFHLSTGIRHLLWSAGYFFSVKAVEITGVIAIISSIILTYFAISLINFNPV